MSFAYAGGVVRFSRVYNSQSTHNVAGGDGGYPGMYGNGWTNNLDVHMMNGPNGDLTVVDGSGTRFDYSPSGTGTWISPPGQHAQLTFNGTDGYYWTQKDGTVLLFWGPNVASQNSSLAPLAGRLSEIFSRNHNSWLVLDYYTWTGKNLGEGAHTTAVIDHIVVSTQSGASATLQFANFSEHQLLSTLTGPDGQTTSYNYDQYGDLVAVDHPGNGSPSITGGTLEEEYGYQSGSSWMQAAYDPRWVETSGTAGGYEVWSGFSANGAPGSSGAYGVMNFAPADGTSSLLQPSVATGAINYLSTAYAFSGGSTQATDSDGHNTLIAYDSLGRQTQNSVTLTSGGSSTTLTTSYAWDANNDQISVINAAGSETDAVYDTNGNMVAIAGPVTSTADGTMRPTELFSYDAFNNVTASCNAKAVENMGATWGSTPPPSSDGLCPANPTYAAQAAYAYPSPEPYGELQSTTDPATAAAPSGYVTSYSYNAAQEGGTEYGLPTSVSAPSFTQADGSTRQPAAQVWYDSSGRPSCYFSGNGYWLITYDAMGRALSVADPDDTANGTGLCGKTGGQSGWNTATTVVRNPDGSVSSTQNPIERAAGVSTAYSYDQDGNEIAQVTHFAGISGTWSAWFDGADRMVDQTEPTSAGQTPWASRYLYDLSYGAGETLDGKTLAGHGNMIDKQRYTASGWLDLALASYDAANRTTTSFAYPPCPYAGAAGAVVCSNSPAASTYTYNSGDQLSMVTDPLNEQTQLAYDPMGNVSAAQYSGDGGVTPAMQYTYRGDGLLKTATSSAVGALTYTHDLSGNTTIKQEPDGTVHTYGYYPDGSAESLSVSSATLSASPLFEYAYRPDGLLSSFLVEYRGAATMSYQYTAAGRLTARFDTSTAASETVGYFATGLPTSVAIPSGTFNIAQYDGEGDLQTYFGYGGESVNLTYDERGELTGQSFSPNALASDGLETWPAFGVTSDGGTLIQDPSEAYDARTGAVLAFGSSTYAYDAKGRLVSSPGGQVYTYDADNRLLTGATDDSYVTQNCGGTGSRITAQGQRDLSVAYSYGPDGNVYSVHTGGTDGESTYRHWDGGLPTFSVNGSGSGSALTGVQAGADGFISSNTSDTTGLNVTDRDSLGNQISSHNTTGYAALTPANPYHQSCVADTSLPPSAGYVAPAYGFGNVGIPAYGIVDDGYNQMSGNSVNVASALQSATPGGTGGSSEYRSIASSTRHPMDQSACGWHDYFADLSGGNNMIYQGSSYGGDCYVPDPSNYAGNAEGNDEPGGGAECVNGFDATGYAA